MAMLPPGEAALAGRIVTRTTLFEEPTAETTYLLRFAALVKQAEDAGLIVTIERQPLKPLAMGNAQTVIDIRPARAPAPETRQQQWLHEFADRRIKQSRANLGLLPPQPQIPLGGLDRTLALGLGPSIETGDA
jgi:hypothetical protein